MLEEEVRKLNVSKTAGGKKNAFRFALFLIIVIIIFLLFILNIILGIKLFSKQKTDQIAYSEKGNLSYSVCLKENTFFEEECLGMDREYIASIIKDINIDFDYSFSASRAFNYNYTYYVTSQIIATEKKEGNKVIYDKTETLIPKKETKMKDSNYYSISDKVSIDYAKYNDVMKNFKQQYAILFDSKLVITLYIKTNGHYDLIDKDLKSNKILRMEIPLSEQTIDITFNQREIDSNNTLTGFTDSNRKNISYLFIGSVTLDLLLTLGCILYIFKRVNKKNSFEIEVSKIMKEYDRFITTIDNQPAIGEKEILSVGSFQELLDTRECLNKPILFYEIKKKTKGSFLIVSEDIIYMYSIEK